MSLTQPLTTHATHFAIEHRMQVAYDSRELDHETLVAIVDDLRTPKGRGRWYESRSMRILGVLVAVALVTGVLAGSLSHKRNGPAFEDATASYYISVDKTSKGKNDKPDPPSNTRITIEMVTVGNPGNANDPLTGKVFGAVNHEYKIGKYEVTIQQYVAFLNSVAGSDDPYELYNPNMGSDLRVAGIRRFGSPGSYQYEAMIPAGYKPAGADSPGDRPITYIDWFDAARFANWMHNGQVANSTEQGAYMLNGATSGNAVAVNRGAKFYIPTESEWYKAAFYSPKLNSGAGGYYLYATQSNSAPGNMIGSAPRQANFYGDSGTYSLTQSPFLVDNQNYLTNVGAFASSPSFYGTFDQGGNAYEWNDLNGAAGPLRSLRSGFFQSNQGDLSVLDRYVAVPVAVFSGSGFRLAAPVDSQGKMSKQGEEDGGLR
eukprot:g12856.t1